MVFGKLSETISDISETLRRVFQDPLTHALDPSVNPPGVGNVSALTVEAISPPLSPSAVVGSAVLCLSTRPMHLPTQFQGNLKTEEGWARWAAGALVCEMPVFGKSAGRHIGIPPLPKRATCLRQEIDYFKTSSRSLQDPFLAPAVRGGAPDLGEVVVHRALELALELPIAFTGQNFQALPKPLWMRYSLQIVKATGENIRNLDLLGLYHIPSKGVGSMRHDAKSGNLFLQLTAEAARAPRLPFLLAKRKDDRSLVSCFLEEG